MGVAELVVVQGELDSDEMQGEIERGELSIVRRRLGTVEKSSEKGIHQGKSALNFLVVAGLLGDDCGCSAWNQKVLLSFEISFLSVANEELGHVVDNHADPLAVHNFKATDSFKSFVTLLEGSENFIGIIIWVPASLLIQKARVLDKVGSPLDKGVPFNLVFCDARLVKDSLCLHELLKHLLRVDFVLTLHLNFGVEKGDDARTTSHFKGLCQLVDPLAC